MLSLAEMYASMSNIDELGQAADQQIADNIPPDPSNMSQPQATKQAKSVISDYTQEYRQIMDQAMWQIASNTLVHYQQQVGKPLPNTIVNDVVADQYARKYYGMNLQQRLILMKIRLNRVAQQTAATGVHNLGGLFSAPFPFGAQTNISQRLLRGTAIKVEQDVAKKVAGDQDISLIRWTLAKQHKHSCECEVLADMRDKKVEKYLDEHNMDINSKGLFFVDDLPDPPHPNCQCEFNLVGEDELIPGQSKRPFHRVIRLLRKLFPS